MKQTEPKILTQFCILICFCLFLASCATQYSEPKKFFCPPVEQNCYPAKWIGTPVDTSAKYRDTASIYYVFESMKNVNSPDDEWCISFITDRRAILTFTDITQQKSMIMRIIRDNEATLESGIGVPIDGHFGAISVRGNKIAFAGTESGGFWSIGNSDIYIGELQSNLVVNIQNLSKNFDPNGQFWESQPTLSFDGEVIFFAADFNTSYGGTDLYFIVKLNENQWSEPINCGNIVNSKCDELTPFISKDGKKLLFASSGHKTIGGYDIFESKITDDFWKAVKSKDITKLKRTIDFFTTPENLKPPLNTPADELFPSSPDNHEELLYYSSNQASNPGVLVLRSGGFDIYLRRTVKKQVIAKVEAPQIKPKDLNVPTELQTPEIKLPEFEYIPTFIMQGTVQNARTEEIVTNSEIIIREIPNPIFPNILAYKMLNDKTGKYTKEELEKDREYEITTKARDLNYDKSKIRIQDDDTLIIVKTNDQGKYRVELEKDREYEITAQAPDLFFDSYKFRIDRDDTATVISKTFKIPEKLTLRINFPTDVYRNPYKYVLDSNGVETNKTWQEELDLLSQNLIYYKGKLNKIKLIGHTDDVGTVEYNYKLGLNRVNFVISELIKRNVDPNILIGESAGELSPLPRRPNESLELYRKRLRRVELEKIIEE